jgi:2-dehydro-3-deoxyphosphooctonate aldolase (KDO 8-P synthase)
MRELGYPIVFDATHSVQLPSGAGAASAGRREFIFPLARAAVAVGVEAIFMEVHEDPAHALCDGENSVRLDDIAGMLEVLKRIGEAL